MADFPNEELQKFFRYGFFFFLLFFFYGTLFPFQFDFSQREIARAWAHGGFLPFWDLERGRIASVPDSVANILLTVPVGFFGVLHRSRKQASGRIWKWWALGIVLGLAAEVLQLAIPTRSSSVTDVLNNGFGALAGALGARVLRARIPMWLEAAVAEQEYGYGWLLSAVLATFMLAPFDFSLDISHILRDFEWIRLNPWDSGVPIADGWIQMAGFVLVGALAARRVESGNRRHPSRLRAFLGISLLLPTALEFLQLFVDSHAPSFRDLVSEIAGAMAGFLAVTLLPALRTPLAGLVVVSLALAASGLSPFHFAPARAGNSFVWIPFLEYYRQTTAASLYDAMMGFASYALWGGLMQRAFRLRTAVVTAVCTMIFAGGIEWAQLYLPSRYGNLTDILIAGLGAWSAALICSGIASSAVKAVSEPIAPESSQGR